MTDTLITVQGQFSAWYPAERATVTVAIQLDGPDRDAVFSTATASADAVRASIIPLHDAGAGPVTWWASDSVRVSSSRPWTQDGSLAELVYNAAIGFTVKFSDFETLSSWIEGVAAVEGSTVSAIDWQLTDATRTAVTTEVRSRSVKDAVTKASIFAQSIGLASVTAIALADPGMLGDQGSGASAPGMFRAMKADSVSGGGGLSLKPEQIEVASVVDARFIAS